MPRAPEPEPIDELSTKIMEAITEALHYTDPKDQADRLIWEMDRIIPAHKETGAPTPLLAQDLLRAVTAALKTDDFEKTLTAGTGEALQHRDDRVREYQERLAEDRRRWQSAYNAALPRLQDEFRRRSVLDETELRRVAAQAFVVTGIKDPGSDLDGTMRLFRKAGVDHEGQRVQLVEQETVTIRGKPRVRMTTGLHIAQEQELIRLARAASADGSAALTPQNIGRAATAFLKAHPEIDASGPHWRAQRGMIDHLGTGGRLGVVIGVPGSGKTFSIAVLADAWREAGREVYGISLAWRQAGDFQAAGINERASIAAFLKRVETGRYDLNSNSVIVVDEVGLVGSRQMLDLLRIREQSGAQLVMVGDPRQNQPIEGASALELLRVALGDDAVPRLLHSTRQNTEREREISALFRRGKAGEAIEMKREDGTAILVSGGRDETIQRVARLWRERAELHKEDPTFTITISTPTNADAREIGVAIRDERRAAGQIGGDVQVLRAVDRVGQPYELPLAIGDKVRLFDRVYDPQLRRVVGNNGDVVEVLSLRPDGMRVRNMAGLQGTVLWNQIRPQPDAPVRLTYGYALTVDTAQGSTASEHIYALPSGSSATHGFKSYVAATRHRDINWLMIDETSERETISERSMLGHRIEITEQDIWQSVAKHLAREPQKPNAISVLQQQRPVAA